MECSCLSLLASRVSAAAAAVRKGEAPLFRKAQDVIESSVEDVGNAAESDSAALLVG